MKAPAGFLATVSALAVAGFASGIGGIVGYRAALQVGRTTAAEHMARAVQIAAADVPGGATAEAIVEELARSTGYRVTLFGPAGEGMADSAFPSSAFSGDAGA
ncbi:MAG: hypothetical protein OEO23_01425, partial [Gemmatimonadota bacterium]|nr:hypothetical protein [Gemmatimonadota bacterium]